MTDHEPTAAPAQTTTNKSPWKRRVIVGAVSVGALVIAWVFAVTVIPRWWAQRIGDVIDGRLAFGSFVGVVVGLIFSLLPLLVLLAAWRFRRGWAKGWRRSLMFVVIAAMLATPNLATLGIVIGNGNAAHAGERILDVDGPGFRGGTLFGVLTGVGIGIAFAFLTWSRRKNKQAAKQLKSAMARQQEQS